MFIEIGELKIPASLKAKLGTDDDITATITDAMDIVRNYLSVLYDCDKAFAATGNDRNKLLIRHIKSIVKYTLYENSSVTMNEVADNNYTEAMKWLKDAGNGTIPTTLPTYTDEDGEEQSFMFLGGKKKYSTDN
jgi:phage gp36-like protein